jgi:cyclopropane-fatty-acyl-phospholipid synthase
VAETNKHYDIPSEFFSQFLDPYMKYTSGLFVTGQESLATGILNMLNRHVGFLGHYSNPRILEIGPGWGSFISRLNEESMNYEYTAVNPSTVQNKFIQSRLKKAVRIIESSFEDANLEPGSFDIIYFIGSFCHMKNKPEQLKKLNNLLAKNGRVIIEDTFFISEQIYQQHAKRAETKFVQDEVFGFAEILSLPHFLETSVARGFQVQSLLEHSQSYSRTIQLWLEKLKQMKDHPNTDEFVRYLEIAQRGWQYTIANYLLEMKKVSK